MILKYLSKLVAKAEPFFLNKHFKSSDCTVEGVKHEHGKSSQLSQEIERDTSNILIEHSISIARALS